MTKLTSEQMKVAYWKWVNDMVLLTDMSNMFLPKKDQRSFLDELPDTDIIEVQYEFMLNYNKSKAKQLIQEMSK